MNLFPTTASADIITGFTGIVTANMGTVLAVFAALFGVMVELFSYYCIIKISFDETF